MRTTFDFAPLWRSTVGFDHLFDLIDTSLKQAADDAYPPYNIERSGEDAYRITLAVAGFGQDDVSVTAEQNCLIIEGKKSDQSDRQYLYHGIATRAFRRVFNLADHVQVKGARLQDGILNVDLVREVPEAMKPRRIAINSGDAPLQLDRKKAA
jgi:molecular chaperone IbpA